MGKFIDLTGQRFGRLVVIERVGTNSWGNATWKCSCDCGNTCIPTSRDLRDGSTKSCGCLNLENITKHGMAGTKVYRSWKSMISRCYNPNSTSFEHYGGRGITVCDEWKNSFEVFYRNMGPRPEGTSIDRIDVNGNYEPGNCRWATKSEQDSNRRNNYLLTYLGEIKPAIYFARKYNIPYETFTTRLRRGWPIEDAITRPVGRYKKC